MGKIRSFELKKGSVIGNYVVDKPIKRGWQADVYRVREIATDAIRALKIYAMPDDDEKFSELKDLTHMAWAQEEYSNACPGLFPRYYHMGHVFLPPPSWMKEGNNRYTLGNFYIVQEFLDGKPFSRRSCTDEMSKTFVERLKHFHSAYGLAAGDLSEDNLLIANGQIRIVDWEYGSDERPNREIQDDVDAIGKLLGQKWARRYRETADA